MAKQKGVERLSWYSQQKGDFTSIDMLIKEARVANLWIWSTGRWYTPDEFYDLYKDRDLTNDEINKALAGAKIRDPRAGINAGFKQLDELLVKNQKETEDLRNKLLDFNKKVIEYYQSKSDGKKLIG